MQTWQFSCWIKCSELFLHLRRKMAFAALMIVHLYLALHSLSHFLLYLTRHPRTWPCELVSYFAGDFFFFCGVETKINIEVFLFQFWLLPGHCARWCGPSIWLEKHSRGLTLVMMLTKVTESPNWKHLTPLIVIDINFGMKIQFKYN